ncbi:hypothetical protein Cst_c20000 [Thermoclostridium stercorarium subsp. stercorarium DSM 8532]|jgi:cytoskeletal protein CcmA (bactofilin family)|uniref:Cell shape determination protein CcmA n=2 Tax=Thermoclostridium stercorarium TaxID=1510 RepID=L7VTS0_THES1|nr:polymer-forming cytoskeletal protein [Thermoclostridium stercorarium]AGC68973.1 hypothetical protein Cst_c20000 [Thermoclostridium stercorarium subsp. stercorarium DSM 8532]AGI39952.1 CcmA [Thermoclostridium stercorarium subsp. stercorarium DSM 8532]ANW99273.1 cell shape determination protein CcmA [Thermoclostridium stercorarium subsp. thermolacticum DSM 2910]UZQ84945.1 polymer-forming cytoskeletal protein [Thermoclostridium stercorarium]
MKKNKHTVIDTVIGENTTITGNIESDGSIKIEGRVEGDIKAAGDVTVLANGVVKGNIWCENVILSGTVTGNIYARNNLHLESTARLKGDVEIHTLVSDQGAVFEGNCKMVEPPADEDKNRKKKFEFKLGKPQNEVIEKEG